MSELLHGPAPRWEPSSQDTETIERLLSSSVELDRAYGEAYSQRLWVKEFGNDDPKTGITAVGELDKLALIEFRAGVDISIDDLTLGDCVELGHPGRGTSRAERVRDGLRQALDARSHYAGKTTSMTTQTAPTDAKLQTGNLLADLVEDETETEIERLRKIESAATKLFVQVWRGIQNGIIADRSRIDDAALELRDALNPEWPVNTDWLPEELRQQ